jgi:hypothetical protein
MEPQHAKFQTSFVPQKPVVNASPRIKAKKSSFFTIFTTIIFLGFVVAAVGVFVYKIGLENQITGQLSDIEKAREKLDEALIGRATALNDKIISIGQLLNDHQAPSQVLGLLETHTLPQIRILNFEYEFDAQQNILISGSGIGVGYESIILQSDEFSKSNAIKDLVFSSVQRGENNLVNFNFSAKIDRQFVLYGRKIGANRPTSQNTENSLLDEVSLNFNSN